MRKFSTNLFFIMICLAASPGLAGAQESPCQTEVLAGGTVEGILADIVADDSYGFLSGLIILDNSEYFSVMVGAEEDDAEKYYGLIGDRVAIEYDILQTWLPSDIPGEGWCASYERIKSATILIANAAPELKKEKEEQNRADAERRHKYLEKEARQQATQSLMESPLHLQTTVTKRDGPLLLLTSLVDAIHVQSVTINHSDCDFFVLTGSEIALSRNPQAAIDAAMAFQVMQMDIITGITSMDKQAQARARGNLEKYIRAARNSNKENQLPQMLQHGQRLAISALSPSGPCGIESVVVDTDKGQWSFGIN